MTQLSIAPADNAPMNSPTEETEITLGTGKMLAVFFGLVILCAIFFGLGYSMGRNSTKPAAELLPPPTPMASRTPQAANPSPTAQTPAAATPVEHEQSSSGANPGGPGPAAPSDQSASPGGTGGEAGASTEANPGAGYFVQVAAVTKQEDAEALVESLKGRQYQAFVADSSPDQLFHVQLGPFENVKDAEAMRTRLVNDGYNPILKK